MQKYTKFITAALAFVGVILASGLLDGAVQAWVSTIVAGIGAALVYILPNAVPEGVILRDPKTGRFVAGPAHAAKTGSDLGTVLSQPEPDGKDHA